MNDLQVREWSERIVDMVMSDDAELHKTAKQDLDDYTRIAYRETDMLSNIIDPTPFDKDKLVPQMHTDQPVMLFEYEQTSPFAVSVDYGTSPQDFIPRGRRYPAVFLRNQTRNVVYDLMDLQAYRQDVRQIMGDNMTKDLTARRDMTLIRACNNILGGVGTVLPWVGKAMHVDFGAPLTHTAFARAGNVMKDTPFHIRAGKVLMNDLRQADFEAMAVEELQGTDKSVELAVNGFTSNKWNGMQILMTIKGNLVPYSRTYWFGPQEFLGRYIQWIPPTMSLKKHDTFIEFYLYEVYAVTIAHPGAVAIVEFQ